MEQNKFQIDSSSMDNEEKNEINKSVQFKNKILIYIKYAVSIGLIILILIKVDFTTTVNILKNVNLQFFIFGLVIMSTGLLVRSYKWKILLDVQTSHIGLLKIFNFYYMSFFFNNFFLGSIGGDAFRFYKVIKYSESKSGAASSVFVERASGFFAAIIIILAIGLWFLFTHQTLFSIKLLIVIIVFGVSVGLIILSFVSIRMKKFNLVIPQKIFKITNILSELAKSVRGYKNHKKILIFALILSFGHHILQSCTIYIFALSINGQVAFLPILFISLLAGILVMIPISLNGIGIQEGTYVFYLEQIGLAAPDAFVIALLARFSILIFSLIGGLLFLIDNDKKHY